MPKLDITRRQQDVYDYLVDRHWLGEPPPTLEELCSALDVSSRGSMHKHVHALIDAGLIKPVRGKQRGIRLVAPPERTPEQLPLFGYIAAGKPIEAIESPEYIEVPIHLRTEKPCFVLSVKGDSMIDDGIFDGDWVVIEQRDHARNGEIVVALIQGQDATLKRITQRRKEVILTPANSSMKPMVFTPEEVQIQGVVVGQMRSYR